MRVDPATFEERYRDGNDPWDFAHSPYEQHRYDVIESALSGRHYERCFEPGCSLGVLTERLARRADLVIAADPSASALASASRRLAAASNVTLIHGAIPESWPPGRFDLIVFSELGYYWDTESLESIARQLRDTLEPGGDLVAVHWLGTSEDHVLGGQQVHEVLYSVFGGPAHHLDDDGFIIDRWRR